MPRRDTNDAWSNFRHSLWLHSALFADACRQRNSQRNGKDMAIGGAILLPLFGVGAMRVYTSPPAHPLCGSHGGGFDLWRPGAVHHCTQ